MLKVIGLENFRLEVHVSNTSYDKLVNVMINTPRNDASPFASIIFKNLDEDWEVEHFKDMLENNVLELEDLLSDVNLGFGSYPLMKYTDEYDELVSGFPNNVKFHNILTVFDCSDWNDYKKMETKGYHDILIASVPINGILQPIRKSQNFTMFDGKFLNEKEKMLFIYIEIFNDFHFDIAERDHFRINITRKSFTLCVPPNTVARDPNAYYVRRNKDIEESSESWAIPYCGREFLLHPKRRKNLFPLENRPKNIIERKDGTIEVKNGK